MPMKTSVSKSYFNKATGLHSATLLWRNEEVSVFLWILQNFLEYLLYITPPSDGFSMILKIPFSTWIIWKKLSTKYRRQILKIK